MPRDAHGTRIFDEESISRSTVYCYLPSDGMSLADIRLILDNPDDHALSVDVMGRPAERLKTKCGVAAEP